jgi:putative flippase GtrA
MALKMMCAETLQSYVARYADVWKFLFSGGFSAIINLGTFAVLAEWVGIWYLYASAAAYSVSFFVNFFLQKFWAFQNQNREQIRKQMGLFLANSLLNLALNTAFMYGLVDVFGVHHILAQALVIGVLAAMNYTLYRLYIFKPVATPTQ